MKTNMMKIFVCLPLDKNALIIADPLLDNFSCFSKESGLEALFTIHVGEGRDESGTSGLGNPLEINLLAPTHSQSIGLNKILK
jgi:hypothetical protein